MPPGHLSVPTDAVISHPGKRKDTGNVEEPAVGGILLLISIIYALIIASVLNAKKITDSHAHVRGAGVPFLESLPVWRG